MAFPGQKLTGVLNSSFIGKLYHEGKKKPGGLATYPAT
jgi:hypothetical protein